MTLKPGAKDESTLNGPPNLVRTYLEALLRQDVEALCALVTDHFVLACPFGLNGGNAPEDALAWRGIDDYRDHYCADFRKTITVQRLTDIVIRRVVDSDMIYAEAFGDMIWANGRPYKNRYVFRFDFRNGKICELLEFCNPITGAIAAGLPLPVTSPV